MEYQKPSVSPLAMVEMETLAEGREWMRHRMEEKLQRLADEQGAVSPPQRETAEGNKNPNDTDSNQRR